MRTSERFYDALTLMCHITNANFFALQIIVRELLLSESLQMKRTRLIKREWASHQPIRREIGMWV